MKHTRYTLWIGTLAFGLVAAVMPSTIATDPVWDWQASYVLNSSGDVTSRSLDFSSAFWISCLELNMVKVVDTTTSTSDTTNSEADRMDTSGFYLEKVQQLNGQIHTQRWHCQTGGSQIAAPGAGDGSCQVPIVGGTCVFGPCDPGQFVGVTVTTAVLYSVSAACGNGGGSCSGLIAVSTGIGGCSGGSVTTTYGSAGACAARTGIYVNARCYAA